MLPPSVRIFVSSQPVDLRQSFDRLAACTKEQLGGDAFPVTCSCSAIAVETG